MRKVRITRRTLKAADAMYFEMFNDWMDLGDPLIEELVDCELFADFEALQEEMSSGSWDCIEAAMEEGQ